MAQQNVGNIAATGSLSQAWDGTGTGSTFVSGGSLQTDPRFVVIAVSGLATVGVQVTGDFAGDLVPEVTVARVNALSWVECRGESATTGMPITDIETPGSYRFDVAGYSSFRLRCSARASGTAAVVLIGTAARANLNGAVVAALNELNATLSAFTMTFIPSTTVVRQDRVVTAATTLLATDATVHANTSSGTFAITIPSGIATAIDIPVVWEAGTVAPTFALASGVTAIASQGLPVFTQPGEVLTVHLNGNNVENID